ncbi:MAG: DUF692 family protein, partial [Planctomycetes bacterium]|nr:DUF692 family protein [Planctomycetota bacterium]
GGLLRDGPDYFEIAPETVWMPGPGEDFIANGFHHQFKKLGEETGKAFVAHGVGFNLGGVCADPERRQRWLTAMRMSHQIFDFQWYTDHLGLTVPNGEEFLLPIGLPYTHESARVVADSLASMQTIVPDVGLENSVFYFHLGDPLAEPEWIARCIAAPNTHLLLDLHNVYTTALNVGYDPREYIDRMPLDRVIEIHMSGGSWSDPGWLKSQKLVRLDSHDEAIPEEVWALFEQVLPRCPALRGVTLERMEGTLAEPDVERLTEELHRLRRTVELTHAR